MNCEKPTPPTAPLNRITNPWLIRSVVILAVSMTHRMPLPGQVYMVPQRSVDVLNGCARLKPEIFAAGANPAVLGSIRQVSAAASAEDAWSLPELTYSRLAAGIPLAGGAAGIGITHSGNADYQESGMDLGYGLPVSKGEAGILVHYVQAHAAGYAPVTQAAAACGLRLRLLPKVLTGFAFSVPFAIARQANRTDKPVGDYRIELGVLVTEQLSVFAAWVKTDGLAAAIDLGLDYAFAGNFYFVAGLHGRTAAPFGKAGWSRNGWRLAVFTTWQAPLGFSPGLVFSWSGPDRRTSDGNPKKEVLP